MTEYTYTLPGLEEGKIKALNPRFRRHRILSAFLKGEQLTSLCISQRFSVCDPQSEIRYLRDSGYKIKDRWILKSDGKRYKIYYWKPSAIK